MNTRTTLFLAVVALGILVYLVTVGLDRPGTDELKRRSERVFMVDATQVNRLELQNAEGSYVLTKGESGKWMIEKPLEYPADDNAVSALLSELEYARRKATLDEKEVPDQEGALALFGLRPARIQLKIRTPEKTLKLNLGNDTAREGSIYALISDGEKEELAIVGKDMEVMMAKGLNEWRSRKIFDFMTTDVSVLTLRKDGAETEAVKEGALWKISKPLMTSADENEVASFLVNLSSAQAAGFVADNAADIGAYGLSSPVLVLDIGRGAAKDTIRVGTELPEEKGFYYAQLASRPTVFKINDGLYQLMAGMMDKLRDRRLFVSGPGETIRKLKIQKGDLVLDLEASGQGWAWSGGGTIPADGQKVAAFLENLKALRARAFIPVTEESKQKTPPAKALWSVTLEIQNQNGDVQEKILRFHAPKKGEVSVETPFRAGLVSIPETEQPALPAMAYEWYGKQVTLPFTGEPDFVEWNKGDGKPFRLKKGADGNWPVEAGGEKIERLILDRQLQLMAMIPVREWLPANDRSFGLPYLRLTCGHGEKIRVLEFGKELENGWRMARIQGSDMAFVMSNEVYLLFSALPFKEKGANQGNPAEAR